jgi:hypothetical protein
MNKNISGQSLFEIVIALALSVLIIVSLVSLAANAVRNSTYSRNKTQAARYSQEATEWLRGQRDTSFDYLYDMASVAVYCFPVLDWTEAEAVAACPVDNVITGTIFRREISFARRTISDGGINKSVIDATVNVYWQDAQGVHEVKSATSFTDWREQ